MLKQNAETILLIPSQADVTELKVNDLALDCFGRWSPVTEISYRGKDVRGAAYVGFYTSTGPTSSVSGSYKVGVLVRTVKASAMLTGNELDDVERYMKGKGERLSTVPQIPQTAYTSLVSSSRSGF